MRSKEIKKAIDGLAPWEQRYEMEGQFTAGKKVISVEKMWETIRELFCENLEDKRILDINFNAGYYTTMLAIEKADITAVDPSKKHYSQARWTQYFFEQRDNKKYPIKFINKNFNDLDYSKLGIFDYTLLLSGIPKDVINIHEFISRICQHSEKIILVTPNTSIENSIGYYNGIFLKYEFYMLRRRTNIYPIVSYGPLVKEPLFLEQINK